MDELDGCMYTLNWASLHDGHRPRYRRSDSSEVLFINRRLISNSPASGIPFVELLLFENVQSMFLHKSNQSSKSNQK